MKICKTCSCPEPQVHFSPVLSTKSGRRYPNGKFYATCDACREEKMTTKKICSLCDEPFSLSNFYMKHTGLESCCKACSNKRKNAARATARATEKAEVTADPAVNAFHWRAFVQPVPMKASKWEQQPRPDQAINTRFTQYQ